MTEKKDLSTEVLDLILDSFQIQNLDTMPLSRHMLTKATIRPRNTNTIFVSVRKYPA